METYQSPAEDDSKHDTFLTYNLWAMLLFPFLTEQIHFVGKLSVSTKAYVHPIRAGRWSGRKEQERKKT